MHVSEPTQVDLRQPESAWLLHFRAAFATHSLLRPQHEPPGRWLNPPARLLGCHEVVQHCRAAAVGTIGREVQSHPVPQPATLTCESWHVETDSHAVVMNFSASAGRGTALGTINSGSLCRREGPRR